jgi:hypothetical protein
MNRRKFIEKSGVIGFAAFLPVSTCLQVTKIQDRLSTLLYTDEMARDPLNTLKYFDRSRFQPMVLIMRMNVLWI